jgi:hypothetical protein
MGMFDGISQGLGLSAPKIAKLPELQKQKGIKENPLWSDFAGQQSQFQNRAGAITSGGLQTAVDEYGQMAKDYDPSQVSKSTQKAMEGVDKRSAEARDRAVAEGQRGAKQSIASQGLYGRGAGGSRERASMQGQRQASIRQSEVDKQADIQKTTLESAGLQSNEAYKRQLMGGLPGMAQMALQGDIQATQPMLQSAQLAMDPLKMQQGVEQQNTQQANQMNMANWQAQNSANAAQGQAFGNMVSTAGTVAGMMAFCDARGKDVLSEMDSVLESIRSIDLYKYLYKQDTSVGALPTGTRFGPMAQQVQEVIPEAVGQYNKDYLGIDKDQIIWTLFAAVKELDKKVHELEKGE